MKNEKYEFLYNYSKVAFEDELQRFKNAEDKASKFIGLLSIVIVAYTAMLRFSDVAISNPSGFVEWANVAVVGFTFMALASSWSLLFRSLNFVVMPRLPLDEGFITNFKIENLSTNHYRAATSYSQALKLARSATGIKTALLEKAYTDISFSAWLLSISLILLAFTSNLQNRNIHMPDNDDNTTSQQQQEEPNFEAPQPELVMVLDSADKIPDNSQVQINETKK